MRGDCGDGAVSRWWDHEGAVGVVLHVRGRPTRRVCTGWLLETLLSCDTFKVYATTPAPAPAEKTDIIFSMVGTASLVIATTSSLWSNIDRRQTPTKAVHISDSINGVAKQSICTGVLKALFQRIFRKHVPPVGSKLSSHLLLQMSTTTASWKYHTY